MRDPLVPPLAAMAAGILAGRYAWLGAGESAWAAGACVALGAAAWWKQSRRLGAACLWTAAFFAGGWTWGAHTPPPRPQLDAAPGEVLALAGCVVEPPAISGERERFVLELEPGARVQVTLYAREGETLPALRYGDRVEVEAKPRTPRRFANPGSFDYPSYLARREIYWTASAPAAAVKTTGRGCGSPWMAAVMRVRTAALERIERLYAGDPYRTGMMQAILIGESFQLRRVWTEDYRSTGTFHALVISGAHVAVLAGFLGFLLRLCFVPRGISMGIQTLLGWLYAVVTGWQAPCVRSAAGLTLFTIGAFFFRECRILNLLAAVAIGFLALDPGQLFEASFQLTFLAVGFIGAFAAPLLDGTSRPLRSALRDLDDSARDPGLPPRAAQFRIEMRLLAETLRLWVRAPEAAARAAISGCAHATLLVYEIVAVSAVVQVGLALPMVIYFHRVGLSGLSANAFVGPLMGLVVPLGFVAVISGWQWPAEGAGLLLAGCRAVVGWHARAEPAWRIPTPPPWLACALAAAFVLAAITRGRARAVCGAALAVLLAVLLWHPFPPGVAAGRLEVTAIDVGQGDSILVAFPDRSLMVVDAGGIPVYGKRAPARMDIGEDVVAPYLWERSVRRVDVLALSHAHEDHIGGLPALLAAFRPRELWTGAAPESDSWRALREQAARAGVRVRGLDGPRRFAFGGTTVDVLAPPADYVPASAPRNNDSLVMSIRWGRHGFLLAGDVERPIEWRMIDGGLGRADVLKVAHHGSRTSTSEEFLASVQPVFAIISAGAGNAYGHPHPAVLERLERSGTRVLRTDLDGLVSIRSDGRRLEVETHREREIAAGPMPAF